MAEPPNQRRVSFQDDATPSEGSKPGNIKDILPNQGSLQDSQIRPLPADSELKESDSDSAILAHSKARRSSSAPGPNFMQLAARMTADDAATMWGGTPT